MLGLVLRFALGLLQPAFQFLGFTPQPLLLLVAAPVLFIAPGLVFRLLTCARLGGKLCLFIGLCPQPRLGFGANFLLGFLAQLLFGVFSRSLGKFCGLRRLGGFLDSFGLKTGLFLRFALRLFLRSEQSRLFDLLARCVLGLTARQFFGLALGPRLGEFLLQHFGVGFGAGLGLRLERGLRLGLRPGREFGLGRSFGFRLCLGTCSCLRLGIGPRLGFVGRRFCLGLGLCLGQYRGINLCLGLGRRVGIRLHLGRHLFTCARGGGGKGDLLRFAALPLRIQVLGRRGLCGRFGRRRSEIQVIVTAHHALRWRRNGLRRGDELANKTLLYQLLEHFEQLGFGTVKTFLQLADSALPVDFLKDVAQVA